MASVLTYKPIDEARVADLVAFLTSERWEYFGRPDQTQATVQASWNHGDYKPPESEGFFIEDENQVTLGVIRLFDLQDDTVVFDIRLGAAFRGRGLGTEAVRWVVANLFSRNGVRRIEANTRHDNLPMRATLRRGGFVKEGHHRAADATGHDWVTYCLLKSDWVADSTTAVRWNDEPRQ